MLARHLVQMRTGGSPTHGGALRRDSNTAATVLEPMHESTESTIEVESSPPAALRIGLFGAFFPEFQWAGNSTTGLAVEMVNNSNVARVVIFCQHGGSSPFRSGLRGLEIRPCWRINSALSLLRALACIIRSAPSLDIIVFNIYVTSFGKSAITNGVGLLLPSLVSLISNRPVAVYLHNLLETQDAQKLGYNVRGMTRELVRFLERFLLATTVVIVPLRSQSTIVEREFGVRVDSMLIPGIERLEGARHGSVSNTHASQLNDSLKILLFGNWGPQKDLRGALEVCRRVNQSVGGLETTVAGRLTPIFSEYVREFAQIRQEYEGPGVRFLGEVDWTQVEDLLIQSDVLLLPYRATGGYSGAMNLAEGSGIEIIAYDHPQLRETAAEIGANPVFVDPADPRALEQAVQGMLRNLVLLRENRIEKLELIRTIRRERVGQLIRTLGKLASFKPIRLDRAGDA